jgi:hypothetical protein
MTHKLRFGVGETVEIIHVAEVMTPGEPVYIMGPKAIFGEYLDDRLATPPMPERDDPLVPEDYDGATLPGPVIDFNYALTTYRFAAPGEHRVEWRLGTLRSNVLSIAIVDDPRNGKGG